MKPLLRVTTTVLTLVGSVFSADLATRSNNTGGDLSGGGHSSAPVLSADSRWLVFLSHANNLVTNDNRSEWLDVFACDLLASNTVLVSVSASGIGGGNGNSAYACVSSNGQFVVFASEADNLVPGDTNGASDVFMRDLSVGTTTLMSTGADGAVGSGASSRPLLSANGRWVVFESAARNLTMDTNTGAARHIFLRDLQSKATELISAPLPFLADSPGAISWNGVVSRDARFVAFLSTSVSLAEGIGSSRGDVYVRDVVRKTNYWASANLPAISDSYRCDSVSISQDGRFVALTAAGIGTDAWLFRYDVLNSTSELVTTNATDRAPEISADGRYIAFESGGNIHRWDASTTNAELVNATTAGAVPVSGIARAPVMTPNGNGIAFTSDSSDLTTNNPGGVFQVYARDMTAGVTRLITAQAGGLPSGESSELSGIALSDDFSLVAFDSEASDLVAGDGNRARDVFIRDRSAEMTAMISVRQAALPRSSGLGHAFVRFGGVSSNAEVVAFTSYNSDLVPNDTNGWSDVFVRNRNTGVTRAAGISANASVQPALSLDGSHLVYVKAIPSLFGLSQLEVHRLHVESGADILITNLPSLSLNVRPAISADGRLVACIGEVQRVVLVDVENGTSEAIGQIVGGGQNIDMAFTPDSRFLLYSSSSVLYAFDVAGRFTNTLSNVSSPPGVAISGNSRFVAAAGPSAPVVLHDLLSQTNQSLGLGRVRHLSLSYDGRYLVAEAARGVSDPYQVVLVDRHSGEQHLITVNTVGTNSAVNHLGAYPQISADGRYVVFLSAAADLVSGDTNGRADIFVRDLLLGATTRIAPALDGSSGNAQMSRPILAADGQTIVFHSAASDLVPGDYNDKRDVFVLKLESADTDGDGLDDDWEVAHFGNLSRDGSGDFDSDGQTDTQEFRAGTDPTNSESVFRVFTVTPLGGGSTRVFWNASPGRSYRVEYKDDLNTIGWIVLDATIVRSGTTASVTDDTASTNHRFYRAVRLP